MCYIYIPRNLYIYICILYTYIYIYLQKVCVPPVIGIQACIQHAFKFQVGHPGSSTCAEAAVALGQPSAWLGWEIRGQGICNFETPKGLQSTHHSTPIHISESDTSRYTHVWSCISMCAGSQGCVPLFLIIGRRPCLSLHALLINTWHEGCSHRFDVSNLWRSHGVN